MKKKLTMASRIASLLGAALVSTALLSGCDTESADELNTIISPDSVTITIDEAVVFTASGGFEYRWSLADDDLGTLNTRTGSSVVYTSRSDPGLSNTVPNTVLQVLSVASTLRDSATTNQVDELFTRTAEAFITHVGIIPE